MSGDRFETVFVPIADPADAEATARAVHRYAHEDSTIIVTHVVEKGEGVPTRRPSSNANNTPKRPTRPSLRSFPKGGVTSDS